MPKCQIFTEKELASFRRSGAILKGCLAHTAEHVKSGITTLELDTIAESYIRSHGGIPAFKGYKGFAHTLCISINDEVVHGVPGTRIVQDGDIVSLDGGVALDGLITDACITVPVGTMSPMAMQLLRVTKDALGAGVGAARGGGRVGDISAAVQHVVEAGGFSCVAALTGHGLGYTVHQYPDVPNIGKAGTGAMLPAGTVIAIEPIVTSGTSQELSLGSDGWTLSMGDSALSAHFEHTVIITEDGCEVIA